jgi:transcriptional regulator with XRE-family HTH domain
MNTLEEFVTVLNTLKANGVTQNEIAPHLSISKSKLSDLKLGKAKLLPAHLDIVKNLAASIKVKPTSFFGGFNRGPMEHLYQEDILDEECPIDEFDEDDDLPKVKANIATRVFNRDAVDTSTAASCTAMANLSTLTGTPIDELTELLNKRQAGVMLVMKEGSKLITLGDVPGHYLKKI